MPYDYSIERKSLFTDDGQRVLIRARDAALKALDQTGAFKMDYLLKEVGGDTWQVMACADRMIELGDIVEVCPEQGTAQNRVFVRSIFAST